jgi:hypothetical protein
LTSIARAIPSYLLASLQNIDPSHNLEKMPRVAIAFILAFALLDTGCKNLAPANEQFQERPNKTVYRAADEETREEPASVAPQQKVPGQ